MSKWAMSKRWKGLKCSECGPEFQIGDEVYYRTHKSLKEHLCRKCRDEKYIKYMHATQLKLKESHQMDFTSALTLDYQFFQRITLELCL
jgi:hypothetical protein